MSLHIFTTLEQLEQTLRQEARTHLAAHGKDFMLLGHFIEGCIPFERRRLCTFEEQALVAWELIRRHARENSGAEGSFRVAQLFVEQLKSIRLQGCSLEAWKQVALKLKEHAQLLWFADIWEAYAVRLSARSWMDEVDVLHAALDELDKKHSFKQLRRGLRIFVHGLVHITPLEQRFFFALEKVLKGAGGELSIETQGVDNPELDLLVDELHAGFECAEEGASSNLNLLRNVLSPSAPAFELCKHMFCETQPETKALPVELFVAPNFCREIREAAKRMVHLLQCGVAPECIAVVLCGDSKGLHAVWQALSAHGIPTHIQAEVPFIASALGQAALFLLPWIEEGFPVEKAHVFFSNPLFEKTFVTHDDIGIGLKRAGLGTHSKQESLDAYVERLSLLQESERWEGAQRAFLERLRQRVEVAKHAVEKIPEEGSFEEMLESWTSALQVLGLNLNALTGRQRKGRFALFPALFSAQAKDTPCSLFEKKSYQKALARENAAGAVVRQWLSDVRLRLQRTEAHLQKLTRKEFAEWLVACLGNEPIRLKEPQTAGVSIAHFKAMRSQEYEHIFFLDMKEGAFSTAKKSACISEALQSLVNAHSARCFFRTQRGENIYKLPEEMALERQNFAQAVVCATKKLWFSYSHTEPDGREALPSSYWQEALRISQKPAPPVVQRRRFATQPDACTTESDFRGHIAQKLRQHFYKQPQKALLAAAELRKKSWFLSLEEKGEAERERCYFRRDRTRKAGPYTGHVWSPKTEQHLRALSKLPWSAHAFGRLSGCGFWFFMSHVLKGEVVENFQMDAGEKAKGILLHRALALLGEELATLSKTKAAYNEAERQKRVADAVEEAQKTMEPLLHPELWALCCRKAEEALWEFLNSKSLFPFGIPQQLFSEQRFEEEIHFEVDQEAALAVASEVSEGASGKQVLKLTGRADRVDFLGDGSVGVVDYKLSKRGSKSHYKESLLRDDFQLLLYLFVFRRRGMSAKQAAWVFMREKTHLLLEELITQEALNEVLEEDTAARMALKQQGKPNLLNRMEALLCQTQAGEFAPRPVDCGYCPFKRACRLPEDGTVAVDSP